MRTTLVLDDQILRAVRSRAATLGTTLSRTVEDLLRVGLQRAPDPSAPRIELPVFRGDGPRPGIDLDRTSEILSQLDDEASLAAR
jgi:hypothetical protein